MLDIDKADFAPARRYAVMGANGSGKTTLLRILAGILKPDSGSVEIEYGSTIGYVPQHPYAFNFSVLKNVMIARDGVDEADALTALRAVGIEDKAQQRANKLSGGETQRLALARVLAVKRRILLLDEPTAAADVSGIDLIEEAIAQYQRETNCTLIVCTHAPAQALRIADELLFMDAGRITGWGSPDEILRNPQNETISAFLKHWRI